jgi:Secretion system C-terminal sorting domain
MKFFHYAFLLFVLNPLTAFAQKWDYQWPMGYEFLSTTIPDISLLDFHGDTLSIYGYAYVNHLGFGANGSFICDEDGHLQLVTNNCAVYDADFQLVQGSDNLTPGWGNDTHCDDQSFGGYIGRQLTVFVHQIGNDSIIYLAHKDNIINDVPFDVLSTKLYVSTLVRKSDGSYYLKEKRQVLDGLYNYGHLAACLHADGDKWWTNMITYNSNEFNWLLIGGQDTIQGPFSQKIGPVQIGSEIGISQAAFSPDGTKLAYNSELYKQVFLYDFNNATAELSNPRQLSYPAGEDEIGLGVSFSLDSRLIYANTGNNLYQIDPADSSVEHIAFHASLDEDNWPVNMGNITLGPDCRMYIGPGSTTYYIHVVHHPNEKGAACGFEARALRAPSNLSFDIPNLPMYRFNGACDSTIQFPFKDTVSLAGHRPPVESDVVVYPNPVQDHLTVMFDGQVPKQAVLQLFDGLGRAVFERELPAINNVFEAGRLLPGMYFWEVKDNGKLLGTGKLVKQ